MATFYLPSSSGYYWANDVKKIKYRVVITESTFSNMKRNINIKVNFWRSDSYQTNRNGTVYVNVGGTVYSATFTTGKDITTTAVTLFNKTVSVPYSSAAAKTISITAKWKTDAGSSSGTGDVYECAYQGGNVTLTKPATYSVTYNANSGTGAPSAQTKVENTSLKLSTTKPTREGYSFKGWGTSSTATTVSYAAGGTYNSNATITLYAIWSLTATVDFEIEAPTLEFPCDTNGKVILSNFSIPFTPIGSEVLNDVSFYYKICWVNSDDGWVKNITENSDGNTYGPYTINQIVNGTITDINALQIPISLDLLQKSLKNCNNSESVKFLVAISSGNSNFATATTTQQVIDCPINNLEWLKMWILKCYRKSNEDISMDIQIQYPLSYSEITTCNILKVLLDNEVEITPSSYSILEDLNEDDNTMIFNLIFTPSQIDINEHKLFLYIDDGISKDERIIKIPSLENDNLLFNRNNQCYLNELIEDNSLMFSRGSRFHATEFIEGEGIFIGSQVIFNEFIER